VSKYTNAERALVKSIVGYLTIKRVPESVNINVGKLWYGIIQTITLLKLIMTTYNILKERCLAFKEITKDPNKKKAVETMKEIEHTTNNQNHKQITLEMVQKKTRIDWHHHKRREVDE
jgi:hypothetical protein